MAEGLALRNLDFAFPGEPALLRGFSLDAAPGEVVALLGPSGCGKSTILRLAAGLLRPLSGTVTRPPGGLAFVFQSPTLLPWRTVAQNVALPLELGARGAMPVEEALRRVGLGGDADRLPRELSGGMAMRASLARAIVTHPALMLLDEPLGALDAITRHRLQGELDGLLREGGATVLLVTHDVDEAIVLADRVVVLGGRPLGAVLDLPVPLARPRDRRAPEAGTLAGRVEAALA